MRTLSFCECSEVSGGINFTFPTGPQMGMMAAAGVVGGIITGAFANAIGPVFTFFGTPLSGAGGAIGCFFLAGPCGSFACGIAGLVAGYYLSAPLAPLVGFVGGGVTAAGLTFMAIK
ncbi:MAG: hypothetical protein ACHQJ6_06875 [Candidatus Berkiellales bacterium]